MADVILPRKVAVGERADRDGLIEVDEGPWPSWWWNSVLARDESLSLQDLLAQFLDSLRLIFLDAKRLILSLFTGFNENNH